ARAEFEIEPVDARGHRGVGREDGASANDLERFTEVEALTDEVADALHAEESGVALVGVENLWRRGAGQLVVHLDRAHAADAKQKLLQQAVLAAAAVQTVGHGAQRVRVL